MNYTEIKNAALSYSDRSESISVSGMIDTFLKVVEARINRFLKTEGLTERATITTVADQEYYAFPADFNGLVDIEIRADDAARVRHTLIRMSKQHMNDYSGIALSNSNIYYDIVANQIQIMSPQDGLTLEVVYNKRVVPLTSIDIENVISIYDPDCYIFGLLVEISSYVKDIQATSLWDSRFKESLESIKTNDDMIKWSGPTLQIKTEAV